MEHTQPKSSWLPLATAASCLLLPQIGALPFSESYSGAWTWVGIIAPIVLLLAIAGRSGAVRLIVVLALLPILFIRSTQVFLLHFSGDSFGANVFTHFSLQAFKVALDAYPITLSSVLLGMLLWVAFTFRFSRPGLFSKPRAYVLATGSLALYATAFSYTPEGRLFYAGRDYFSDPVPVQDFTPEQLAQAANVLAPVRGEKPFPLQKKKLRVSTAGPTPNLILVYLESFSDMLVDHPDYPGLTPNLSRLKRQMIHVPKNYSSGYVTIEGLANSQCGTLFNMEHESDALTTDRGRLPQLPCLGDILSAAGYELVYMGGAMLAFAGKGDFFRDHGYQTVLGWNYWKKTLPRREKTVWGLSDSDLFRQALEHIDRFQQQTKPWNLTLLTLGTHLPGFQYQGCPQYALHDDRFLQAIHCTDYLLGQFVEQLQQRGILEQSLLVIKGDHGVFPNPDMKRLFGQAVHDHRIFTLMAGQGSERILAEQPMATSDLAPSILGMLGIQTNTTFLLGQDMTRPQATFYRLSRYDGYGPRGEVRNHPGQCDQPLPETINLPLNPCEKKRTLQTLYQLQTTLYGPDHPFCAQFIAANTKNHSWRLQINELEYGGKAIFQGRPVDADQRGYRLLLMDKQACILSYSFLPADEQNTVLAQLQKLAGSNPGHQILLSRLDVPWPDTLNWPATATIVHGQFTPQGIHIEQQDEDGILKFQLGTSDRDRTPTSRSSFCTIEQWGPQQTRVQHPFNQQKDGRSAWWLETTCAPDQAIMRLDGKRLDSVVRLPVITAALHAEQLLAKPGKHQLDLLNPQTGEVLPIGTFTVKPGSAP